MSTSTTIPEDLYQIRPWRAAAALLLDWLWIAGAIYVAGTYQSVLAWLIAIIIIGNRQHALAILGHDGVHKLLFRVRWLNDLIANLLCFYPIGATLAGYRRWHFDHHRLLGTPDDPEWSLKRDGMYAAGIPVKRHILQFALDLVGGGIRQLYRLIFQIRPAKLLDYLFFGAYWAFFAGLFWWFDSLWIMALWMISLHTSFVAFFRPRDVCEHTGILETHRLAAQPVLAALLFPHNTWCHYEHHQWPGIPCYNLQRARTFDTVNPVRSMGDIYRGIARGCVP